MLFEIVEPSIREALLEDASDGAGIAFVQFSHPHQWNHLGARLGRPKDFTVPPVTLLEERAFRVSRVLPRWYTTTSHIIPLYCFHLHSFVLLFKTPVMIVNAQGFHVLLTLLLPLLAVKPIPTRHSLPWPSVTHAFDADAADELCFAQVGDVLTSSSHELFYQCGYGSAGKDMSPRPWTLQITLKALRPRVGIDRAAQAVQSGDPYPACIGAQGAVPMKGARSNSGVSIRQYNERVLSGMDPRNSGRTYWQDGPSPSTLSRLSRRIHDVFCDSSPDHLKCNMCRWRGEWCSTKAGICSGTCCIYCRHHAAQQKQGLLSLVEAKGRCNEIVAAKKVMYPWMSLRVSGNPEQSLWGKGPMT